MKAAAVIPARYGATRFPGKPLAKETGKYLIQHVYEQARAATRLDRVIIATDDDRIAAAVKGFGGEVAMTRADHFSGTDRVAEVAARLDCDFVLNVQGDEAEMDPAAIDRVVELLTDDPDIQIATAACPFAVVPGGNPADPNSVKVVRDGRGRALYFSRAPIPYPRKHATTGATHQPAPYLLHLGIYGFRRPVLAQLGGLAPTPLEQTEMLEQLRWLEHGYEIAVGIVERACSGIDTPEDYAAFVQRYRSASAGRS
jgi:3-deoxy-manno-octulosonate cytidylyltransferase (CMP-KDO synthetase)